MTLSDRFKLFSPTYVERAVPTQEGDKTFRFYPIRAKTLARLGPVLAKLGGHLSVLMSSDKADQSQEMEDYTSKDGERVAKTKIQAVNPDLAKLRADQRQKAVEGAISALLDEKNRIAVGEILMCSLREDFPKGPTAQDAEALMDGMDLNALRQMLGGVLEANAKLFGDVGNTLRRAVLEKAGQLLGETPQPASQETSG